MKLYLVGLKAIDLRCAEIDIDLGSELPNRFTFLQMPNGTGKTTIADCLRAILSGEANTWTSEKVRQLQRRESDSGTGHFEARFLIDGRRLAVGINFDFLEGTCNYYTTLPPRGRKPKHDLPAPMGRFADRDFVRLYIFNAELPQELLESGSSRAEQAIDAFYQLYVLGQVSDALEKYFGHAVDQAPSTAQGLSRYRNQLAALKARHAELSQLQITLQNALARCHAEILEKDARFEVHLAEVAQYREQRDEAQAALSAAQSTLDVGLHAAFERLQKPLDASPKTRAALDGLAEALDSLRLPESTSRQFFHELLHEQTCICGRPMDEPARAAIRKAAGELLQDEAAGVINALKDDVRRWDRDEVCQSPGVHANTIIRLLEARDRTATRMEQIRDNASAQSDSIAQTLRDDLEKLRKREMELQRSLSDLEREPRPDDDERCSCIKWFDQRVKRVEEKVSEIAKTVQLRERKNRIQTMLKDARQKATEAARVELLTATNARLEELLPGEDVSLAEIGSSLRLRDREGLNLGAMLSVGYAFLTTLFERGNHSFPFVVDAPSMGLDGMARNALASLLPSVTHQFVGLVLDNERDFARAVNTAAPSDCSFYTIFSDTSRNKPLVNQVEGAEPDAGGTYVIEGADFFFGVEWTRNGEESAHA